MNQYDVWVGWGCPENSPLWCKWEQELEKRGWEYTGDEASPMRWRVKAKSPLAALGLAIGDLNSIKGLNALGACPVCKEMNCYISTFKVKE